MTRLGITCLLFVFAGGIAASLQHMVNHHQNKDGKKGVSFDDIKGSYHGVYVPAPLVTALERKHPETLPDAQRDVLLDWLLGKKDVTGKRPAGGNPSLVETYDSIDMGDSAPIEIIAKNCLSCHSRKAPDTQAEAKKWPLDTLDDVKKISFEKRIDPPPTQILVLSTHTHAISLATMSVALVLLLLGTRWGRFITGSLILLTGAGLACDIGGWWLARSTAGAVILLMVGGAAYSAASVATLVAIMVDLWLPRRRD